MHRLIILEAAGGRIAGSGARAAGDDGDLRTVHCLAVATVAKIPLNNTKKMRGHAAHKRFPAYRKARHK